MAQRKTATKSRGPARKPTKAASHKTKSSCSKSAAAKPGDVEVTVDRRRPPGRRTDEQANTAAPSNTLPTRLERRKKVNRRRQIDPTTCERDYSDDEVQFMNALEQYKRASGRMFPTCSEVLEVVRSLGYVRLSASELASRPQTEAVVTYVDPSANTESTDELIDEETLVAAD